MRKFVAYMQIHANFWICDCENVIICRKLCDIRVLAKYAITYSHITSIPNCYDNRTSNIVVAITINTFII